MKKNTIAVSADPTHGPDPALRIDKWLWHARFFKSRSQAAKYVLAGKVRVNRHRVLKSRTLIRPGDILTFALKHRVYVVEIRALGARRGPAAEAQTLYMELSGAPSMASSEPIRHDARHLDARNPAHV